MGLITFLIGFKLIICAVFVNGNYTNDSTSDYDVIDPDIIADVYYIHGGSPTLTGEFPFMAALGWTDESGLLNIHGGGMLISSKYVLTAAHCVYLNGKLPDTILLGGDSLTENTVKYSVVNATNYPEYDSSQAYFDIALLEIAEPSLLPPVCLWMEPDLLVENVTAIGYGLTEFAGEGSQNLLKVNLTVFPESFCQPFFKRQRKFKKGLSNAHICAGDISGQKDTCQGDSGGPLILYNNTTPYAVGITSTGQACSGFPPAIYTKISSYMDWIKMVLKEGDDFLQTYC